MAFNSNLSQYITQVANISNMNHSNYVDPYSGAIPPSYFSNYSYGYTSPPSVTTFSGDVVGKNAKFDDVQVGGRSILESLTEIEKRLAILVPNPEKLEKFEALRKAYDHYKTLEAICYIDEKDNRTA